MAIVKKEREIITTAPRVLVLYGAPKIGKTTILTKLPKCLIGDTEQGSHMLKGYFQEINNLHEMNDFITEATKDINHGYNYFALDTIDRVVSWIEDDIVVQHNALHDNKIDYFGDLGFGSGWHKQRSRVHKMINWLKIAFPYVIIVGHRKLASIESGIVTPESLELTGKLRSELMARADAVGSVFRDEGGVLKISFKNSGILETGTRCAHLIDRIIDFKWENIYIDGKPKRKE